MPGGSGFKILNQSNDLKKIIKEFNKDKKLISAICAAPQVLVDAGIIQEQKITSYPGYAEVPNRTNEKFEVDQNIITGRDFQSTIQFANEIVKYLKK